MGFFKSDKEKAVECYEKAEQYRKQGNYAQTIPLYEKAAKLGLVIAEHALGEAYYYGRGVKQNTQTAMDYYGRASKYGHHDATYMLARIMSDGTHYITIYSMAIKFAKAAAEEGHKESTLLYGKLLIEHPQEDGDQYLGFQVLTSCAFAGYPGALDLLAKLTGVTYTVEKHSYGQIELICNRTMEAIANKWDNGRVFVKKDFKQIMELKNKPDRSYLKRVSPEAEAAFQKAENYNELFAYNLMVPYYVKAAELGHVLAMREVGNAYFTGNGVAMDNKEALRWYLAGAKYGEPDCLYYAAILIHDGYDGGVHGQEKAISFAKQAAEAGHKKAQKFYEEMTGIHTQQEESQIEETTPVVEEPISVEESVQAEEPTAITKEAEFTDNERYNTDEKRAETFYRIAEDYYKEKQYSKMIAYHKMAADLGHGPSMNCIGYAYSHGEGVPFDQNEAFIWYMKGAEAGCAKAQFNAGKYFAEGIACEADYTTAKALFYQAMMQGHEYAHHYFGRLMIEHPDSDIEIERGIEALITGVFKGFPKSLSTFNELMREEHEVRINAEGKKELVNSTTGEVLEISPE